MKLIERFFLKLEYIGWLYYRWYNNGMRMSEWDRLYELKKELGLER